MASQQHLQHDQQQQAQDEPDLVELHFELEIDYEHAFEQDQVITSCIAEVMGINESDVVFDGVDEMMKGDQDYFGLFRGHIPTTKHQIEQLVSIFHNALQTNELHSKMHQRSAVSAQPVLEIRELYETDQNDEDDPMGSGFGMEMEMDELAMDEYELNEPLHAHAQPQGQEQGHYTDHAGHVHGQPSQVQERMQQEQQTLNTSMEQRHGYEATNSREPSVCGDLLVYAL